jgi:hypothetical protein
MVLHEFAEAFGGEIDIGSGSPLGFLLEAVQHEYRLSELCDIDDAKCTGSIRDPDLLNAGSDIRHGLPVIRLIANLNLMQLMARFTTRRRWKRTQVVM